MGHFDYAFDEVIGLEGGYIDDPDDTGGETNWGIAKKWHPNVDIKNLTKEGAMGIYWEEYWNPLLLGQIISGLVASEVFEQAINMGRKQAILHVQHSLSLLGIGVTRDGIIGQQTIKGINSLPVVKVESYMKCLNGFQFMRYLEIVSNNPSQKKFFVGWLRRI